MKLTIGKKLMAITGALIVLTIVLACSSLSSTGKFKAQFDKTVDVTAAKLTLAEAIASENAAMISAQRAIVLDTFDKDEADLEKNKEAFRQSTDQMRKSIDQIAPLLVTDEGKELTRGLSASLAEWLPLYEDFIRKCGSGDAAGANKLRKETIAPVYTKINASARRLSDQQHEFLAKDKTLAADESASARWIAFLLLGLAFAAGGASAYLVRNISRELRTAVADLSRGAEEVAGAAAQVSSSSQSLAHGASSQAASLEETSASSEEIRAMASQSTETTRAAANLASESQQKFNDANRVLDEMVVAMGHINESSNKISKIIKVIDEIAFQTNILALNAAVEAARAGEAGLGFAVVADEVRNLAQRCAQAAKDTASLIEESGAKSAEGKSKVDQVAEFLRAVTGESNKVKTLVDEVNVGSQEQVRGIEQIARAITLMEQLTQGTAASAEESAAAAEELTAQSRAVKDVVGKLASMVGAVE